jgi:hypothetical protein
MIWVWYSLPLLITDSGVFSVNLRTAFRVIYLIFQPLRFFSAVFVTHFVLNFWPLEFTGYRTDLSGFVWGIHDAAYIDSIVSGMYNRPIVAVTKLHASRSQQNRTTLQHEQRSPRKWRQLGTRSVAKLVTLYWWLIAAWKGGWSPSMVLKYAISQWLL